MTTNARRVGRSGGVAVRAYIRVVYEETRDQFREQANITTLTPTLAAIHHSIVNLVSINEDWVVDETSWYALRLHPGGHDQAVHRDFPTFKTARALLTHELVQASVIVALMNDTYLHAYPGSFGGQVERTRRRTVRLDAGHLIIFSGDLAHAGAGFRGSNVRLHCYVRVNGVPQEPDSTEAVVFRSYRCGRRMHLTYSRAELSEHHQACVLRGGPYSCPFCGQMYAIRNSLNQHVRRRHREPQEQEASSEGGVAATALRKVRVAKKHR
ncbi:Zinc finger, C2H2-like [Phytophthora cactorum]|nr:Zinc finger, C2H2-like [Phytophthora cactorum]